MSRERKLAGAGSEDALGRSPWAEVYDRLAAADPDMLDVQELETLAEAGFWLGRPRESISARQKAYSRYRDAGDAAGAEKAFRRAHEHGRDPQPGLAQLHLARGDAEGAASALRVALGSGPGTPLRRGRLLAAHVHAELQLDNVDMAARSADALAELAEVSRSPLLRAMAGAARGAVLLARADADGALPVLRDACAICRELSCPYEAAETRVLVAKAARQLGDEATAALELDAAKTIFVRLGAAPDVARVNALLARGSTTPGGLTAREVEVLRLVARGRSNREIATELFISEHTVARHLSNIFRKLDVTSRSAATSYAYEHNLA